MSKRKVEFDISTDGGNGEPEKQKKKVESRFKGNHSLDSDEEDNEVETEKYNVLEEDDIEGQEDTHVDYEEGMKFTAFNMRDEMEDGHFDKDGTFIFEKKKEIADGWMDNIDWVKVKELSKSEQKQQENLFNSDDEDEDDKDFDVVSVYKEILQFVKPGETVTRAIKRLGGSKSTNKWQKSKKNDKASEGEDKEAMLKLTGLVDQLSQRGDYDVYTYTYEKLSVLVSQKEEKKTVIPEGISTDDALDMFADGIDEKQGEKPSAATSDKNLETSEPEALDVSNEVCWYYKLENNDEAEIHGPYTSTKMQEYVDTGFFKDAVYVRKAGSDGAFYSSRRIDFELYT